LCGRGKRSRYSDSLRAGRTGDQIQVAAIFSPPVPGPTKPPYTTGTCSLPGLKRPGRGVDHPPTSSAEVKESVQLNIYSSSGPFWPAPGRISPSPLPLPYCILYKLCQPRNTVTELTAVTNVNESAVVLYLMPTQLIKKKRPLPHEPRHFGYPARMDPPSPPLSFHK